MTITIDKGANKQTIAQLWEKIQKSKSANKGLDTNKYCGKVVLSVDPMEIQEQLRNEWQ